MINPDTPRQIAMAVKAYAQKYPYIKEGALLYTIHGPVRVASVSADMAGHITVECTDKKKYEGGYFGLYASRSNAPDAVVSAYDAATRLTWKQPVPQPLMSPDDLTIAPYARQSYLERYNSTELGQPLDAGDPLLNKWHGKTDMYGYERSKMIPFPGTGGLGESGR
jgi:hypothetical protein